MSFLDTTRALAAPALIAAMAATTAPAQEATAPPPHKPLQKTIGQARPEIVPSLIVMNSAGASLADGKLTLTGIAGNSIVFADRPIRSAGHAPTSVLLDEWNPDYPDSFHADPPNATVSAFGGSEKEVYDAVVVLQNPQMVGADLVFDVEVLEGSLDGSTGPAAVFIDLIGRPLTPLSFAGVARRTAFRGAFYAGAAADAAAAAPYYDYGYGPYSEPCGYGAYPPCR
jgi:hypothetical protein